MSLLHRKHLSTKLVVLCNKMDLIAVCYSDGSLAIFRTISWEKVVMTKYDEDVENRPDGGLVAKFSPSGNILTLAGRSISMFDISSGRFSTIGEELEEDSYYLDINWVEGIKDAVQLSSVDSLTKLNYSSIENGFLSVITNKLCLTVFQYGIIPIIQISITPTPQKQLSNLPVYPQDSNTVVLSVSENMTEKRFLSLSKRSFMGHTTKASVIYELKFLVQSIKDTQNTMTRKWREALRVLPPKVELMNSALRGYEMNNGVVDFLHSVVLCGLWHPVASVIFTQHWNEQSLSRLRSTVSSTLKYIQRTIQLQIIPSIESMITLTRIATDSVPNTWPHLNKWQRFSAECLHLLQASDSLLHEVSRVVDISQKTLLFFRSNMIEAGGVATTASHCALYPEDRILLQQVFGSDRSVPPSNPEYLFGTSLLQLLSAEPLRGVSSSADTTRSSTLGGVITMEESINAISHLDHVPHFARQLKTVVEAHDGLCVVYEPEVKSPILHQCQGIESLLSVLPNAHIIARAQSYTDETDTCTSVLVIQKMDFLGMLSYELLVWKETFENEHKEEGIHTEVFRAAISGLVDEANSTGSKPWSQVFMKKEGGIYLLLQDMADTENVFVYDIQEDDMEFNVITKVSRQTAPSQTLSLTKKLSVNAGTVVRAEYTEVRGILALIFPNNLLIFDSNAVDDDVEEGEEDEEDQNISGSNSHVDSVAMSDN